MSKKQKLPTNKTAYKVGEILGYIFVAIVVVIVLSLVYKLIKYILGV